MTLPCDLSKLHSEQLRVAPEARGLPYEKWLFRQPLWTPEERAAWIAKRTADSGLSTPPAPVEDEPQGVLF